MLVNHIIFSWLRILVRLGKATSDPESLGREDEVLPHSEGLRASNFRQILEALQEVQTLFSLRAQTQIISRSYMNYYTT